LIAEMEKYETVDIVEKLAVPLPVTVIADLLGVPNKDWRLIKHWSDILFRPYEKEHYDDIAKKKQQALKEFREYLYPIVQEKRKNPADDIISDLTRAELHGERLNDEEVVDSSRGLLGAGNETTTMLIANIFYCMLFDQPGVYQELREDISLVPDLIEEVLRFRFPASNDRRIVKDTNVFGPLMKKGQMIIAWAGSANRDESQFANAETFDIHRPNNKQHLTFGAGPHFCLGAPLARMEARIALTTFVKSFADIHPVENFNLTDHLIASGVGQSLKSLPIRLEKA
jgi:cytochrome P450 family 106